ncbi:MAG: hypothetical protein ACI4U6_03155, partial [Acutalibacteraceae bacterium]
FNGAKKLLDYGFANYAYSDIVPELGDIAAVSVKGGVQPQTQIQAKENFCLLLKKSEASGVTQKLNLPESVTAPVKEGDVLGTVDFYNNDEQIGSVNITAAESVDKMTFLTALFWVIDGLFK